MSTHNLKFGDLVLIEGCFQPNQANKKPNQNTKESQISGFLSAIGFTDNRIFVQTVPPDNGENIKAVATLNNYRELVFQLWPKLGFVAHKQLRKLNKEKALMVNATEEAMVLFEEKLRKARNRAEEEKEANTRKLAQMMGQPIVYGADLQFLHIDSKSFLTAKASVSGSDQSAYKFELVSEPNSGMVFKLVPRYQLRQEGDTVQFEEQVVIHSVKLNCFVNFMTEKPVDIDTKIEVPTLPPITAPFEHKQLTAGSKRFEALLSQFRDSIWKVYYHGGHREENQTIVKGGDLVKLKHTEFGAFLAADVPMLGKNPEVYGRLYYGDFEEEQNSACTVWQVEVEGHQNRGAVCSLSTDEGKPKPFRLRHVLTGKLLSMENVTTPEGPKNLAVVMKDDPKRKTGLTVFHSFDSDDSNQIAYNSSYGMGLSDDKGEFKYIETQEDADLGQQQNQKSMYNSKQFNSQVGKTVYKPLKEHEFSTKKHVMLCGGSNPRAENAFTLVKVSAEEEYNILFAASSINTLKYVRDTIKAAKNAFSVETDLLLKTIDVLRDLIFFVHKADENGAEETDPLEFEGITVQEKQRLLKDFRVIELLTEILYYPFLLKLVDLEDLSHQEFKTVFQYCYRLIKHIIKEYRPNEIYASQWLEHYMYQAMNSSGDNDIKAETTLIELIDNNKKILDTKINRDMIAKFVEMLKSNKNEKFVNLLRAICVCDGEAVVKNQTDMSRYIIEDEDTRDQLIFQELKINNNKVEVRIKDYEVGSEFWLSLEEFKKTSYNLDEGQKYNYFLSMIYLLADLCLERNYVAIDYLENIYTFEVCFQVVADNSPNKLEKHHKQKKSDKQQKGGEEEESDWELRSAFAKLLTNLWIDRKPYQTVNVPQYLILWDTLNFSSCSKVAVTDADPAQFEPLKNYLKLYYEALAKQGCTKIYETEKNKFTSLILEMSTKLVEFGLYTDLHQLKDLLTPLLLLLNGMKDVMTPQEYAEFTKKRKAAKKSNKILGYGTDNLNRNTQRYEETERTVSVMNIKKQVCELIQAILNFNDDVILRQFLLHFKNQSESQKDRDNNGSDNRSSFSDKRSLFGPFRGNDNDEGSSEQNFIDQSLDFIRTISEKTPLDLNKLAPTNFVRILLDLCLYQNEELNNKAFELLYETHSQRMRLTKMLEQAHILEDVEKKSDVFQIEQCIKELKELAETTETWFGRKEPEHIEQTKRCIDLVKKLESYLVNDVMVLKNKNADIDTDVISPVKPPDSHREEDGDRFGEHLDVDPEYQKILRHLKAYQPLVDILKYESTSVAEERNKVRASVLKVVCKFLAKFARNQKANQAVLMDNIPIYMVIMKNYTMCSVEELIEEIFKGNRTLIRQREQVEKFSKNIIKVIHELKPSNAESAKMLLSLKPFMKYKNQIIKPNQTVILNLLTLKDNKDIYYILDTEARKNEILSKLQAFNQKVEDPNNNGFVELPAEVDYISALLEIIAFTCDGKNGVTESKSQTSWPIDHIALLYENAGHCWMLKRSLLLFVYHVYLDTEREKKGGGFKRIIKGMIADMEKIANNYVAQYEIQYHKGITDNKVCMEKYCFDALLPCIDDILAKRFYADIPNYSDRLEEMLKLLMDMRNLSFNTDQKTEILTVIDKFRVYTKDVYQSIIDKNQEEGELYDTTRELKLKRRSSSQTSFIKNENSKNFKLRTHLANLVRNKEFHKLSELEFKAMIRVLINIEKIEASDAYATFVPFDDVIKSLISLVNVTGVILSKDMMLIGLKAFRRIIERENRLESTSAAEWKGDDWMKFEKNVVQRQNQLCDLGIVDMVCNIISHTKDIDLLQETILVGIALLIGGNPKAQKKFLEYIQHNDSNKFLYAIKELIKRNFDLVKKEMSQKNKVYLNRLYEKEEEQARQAKQTQNTDSGLKKRKSLKASPTTILGGLLADVNNNETNVAAAEEVSIESEEATQSLQILQKVYRFLQLFCEGHNLQMQDQLRAQTDPIGNPHGKSQDFISLTAYYFNTLIKQINVDSIDFCAQMLDFLIESLQGPCEKNQQALAKAKIINACMDFLTMFKQQRDYYKQGFVTSEQIDSVNDATTTAVKLLNALVEGTSDPDIVEEMNTLDFRFLVFKLSIEYQTFVSKLKLNAEVVNPADVTSLLQADSFTQQILESFDIYILIVNLADSSEKVASFLKDTDDYTRLEVNALKFFEMNVGNIEIMFKEKLIKVYFPIYPACRNLTRDSRKDFMLNVNRDSPGEKIGGLVNAAPELFKEMDHMSMLKSQIFVFSMKRFNLLRDFSTLISLIINIIVLATYYFSVANNMSYQQIQNIGELNSEQTINVLGYIQIATSTLMILFWIVINVPIILQRKWRESTQKYRRNEDQGAQTNSEEDPDLQDLPLEAVLDLLKRKGPYDPLFNPDGKRVYGHLFVRLVCYWNNFVFIMSDGKFIFMMFYLAVSIMGIVIAEIVYSLHLLDVINRSDTLGNVIKSVTHNFKQLMLTALLGIILIFLYALIGFYFVDESFYNKDQGERMCSSMIHCFMSTLKYGLQNGGGIGDSLTIPTYSERNLYFFRLVFDLTFFIVINVVILKVIFGIIIDTFAELRDHKTMIDTDKNTYCFICNLDRYTFDKNGTGFEKHIESHHHLWNYLYYIYALNAKDSTEYNGIESYVQDKLAEEDISWFPLHRSLELEAKEE